MSEGRQRKEHRLAMVMNGGVSLAIWMGGLARELDNARRASSDGSGAEFESHDSRLAAEKKLFELWARHFTDTRLIIDVLAGTSAGGLNGVLLAMAAAHDAPLDGLRDLWMRSAELSPDGLLSTQGDEPASVLNGDFFLREVDAALEQLASKSGPNPCDVVLSVTSTALRGKPRMVQDDYQSFFSEPDHRRRFEFRRAAAEVSLSHSPTTEDRFAISTRNDFEEHDALARAARASASFPVAFGPVAETPQLRERRSWPSWDGESPLEWLADGGILDNSPFEPVLEAIARQPVSSMWRRTLCYVVPSANENEPGPAVALGTPTESGPQPPWSTVALSSFNLPREADFRDDIEQLHDLVRVGRSSLDVARFRALIEDSQLHATATRLASAGIGLYREAQAAAGVYLVRERTIAARRFVSSLGDVSTIGEVTRSAHAWLADDFPAVIPDTWTWGASAAQRVIATLLRSLAADEQASDQLRSRLSELDRQAAAVNDAVSMAISGTALPADPSPLDAASLLDEVYSTLDAPNTLLRLVVEAATEYAASRLDSAGRALEVLQAALAIEVVNGAGGVPGEVRPSPLFDFMRMGLSPTPRCFAQDIAEAMTGTANSNGSDILYGTRLNHFAAFGKQEWREWDWLWGRIQGAVHLGRLLNLTDIEVDELVECIVTAEGYSHDQVRRGIRIVFAQTTDSLLTQMKESGEISAAVDATFALLNSHLTTSPPIPRLIVKASWWATLTASRNLPPGLRLGLAQRLIRLLAKPRRTRVWNSLGAR